MKSRNSGKSIFHICPVLLFAVFFTLGMAACSRADFRVDGVLAQPYVLADGSMGLSLYMQPSLAPDQLVSLQVTDPSGTFTWELPAKKTVYEGAVYYGSAELLMPSGTELPQGEWKYVLVGKDGRTVEDTFRVAYRDVKGALERNSAASGAVFDEPSNLTVIP